MNRKARRKFWKDKVKNERLAAKREIRSRMRDIAKRLQEPEEELLQQCQQMCLGPPRFCCSGGWHWQGCRQGT